MGSRQNAAAKARFVDADALEEILELRREGHTISAIAKITGWSDMCIHRRIERYIRGENEKHAPALRELEASRLEYLWEKALESVTATTLVTNSKGEPVRVPVVGPDGELVLDEAGQPVMAYQIDRAPVLAGVAACVRVSERKCKLLGLDLPQQLVVQNNTSQAGPAEIVFRVVEAESGRHLTDAEKADVAARVAEPVRVGLFDDVP
jgi:hypothetical protein